jgi:hypothetical protein
VVGRWLPGDNLGNRLLAPVVLGAEAVFSVVAADLGMGCEVGFIAAIDWPWSGYIDKPLQKGHGQSVSVFVDAPN